MWVVLLIILDINISSFFETFYQRMHDFEKKINSSCGRISDPHIFGNFTCISFMDMYLFPFFLISSYLKVGLSMSNYNGKKNDRYNDAPYSYNKINQRIKISQVGYD